MNSRVSDKTVQMYIDINEVTQEKQQSQEGQLSVSGERMCTILVNHLED